MKNLTELKKEDLVTTQGGWFYSWEHFEWTMNSISEAASDFADGFGDAFGEGYKSARKSNPF